MAVKIVKRLLARFVRLIVYHPVSSALVTILVAALVLSEPASPSPSASP